jgi:predicted signal transduction protein with EAL and GGDEF domain
VETARQLAQLQDLGCQLGQGYFFSRPLTAQAASAMLEQPPGSLEPATRSTRASTRHLAQDVQPTAEGRVVDAV